MSNSYISYLIAINNSLIRSGIHLPIELSEDMPISKVESALNILEPFCYFNDVLSQCGSAYTVSVNDCKAKTYTDVLKEEVIEKYKDKFDMALDLLYSDESNIGNKKVSDNALKDYISQYGKTIDVESLAKIAKPLGDSSENSNLSYNSMFSLEDVTESKYDDYSEQEDSEFDYDDDSEGDTTSEVEDKPSNVVEYDDYETEDSEDSEEFDYSGDSEEDSEEDDSSDNSSKIVYDDYDEETNETEDTDSDSEEEDFDYSDDEVQEDDEEFDYSDDSIEDSDEESNESTKEGILNSHNIESSSSNSSDEDEDINYSDEETEDIDDEEGIDYSDDDLTDEDEEIDYSDDSLDSDDEVIDSSDNNFDQDDEIDYSDDNTSLGDDSGFDYSSNDLVLDSSLVFNTPTHTSVSTPSKPKEKEDYEKTADKIVNIVEYGGKLATRMVNKFKGYTDDKK